MVLPKPTQCTQVNEFLRCINPRQSVYVSPATQCQEVSPVNTVSDCAVIYSEGYVMSISHFLYL